ncbi:MAG: YceI family protein [Gemmatimonadales bacterium]
MLHALTLLPPFPRLLAALLYNASEPAVPAEKFDVDVAHSEIGFSIRFMGLTDVRGRFKEFRGTIMYVEGDPAQSTVTVLIRSKSIDTGSDWRDRDLRGASFFAVHSFPTISFRSTRVERTADGFAAHGPFTLRGVTRDIAIPFRMLHGKMKDAWGNTRIGFVGSLKLNRKDFGVTGTNFWNSVVDLSRMALADTVQVDLTIQGSVPNFERITFGARPNTRALGELLLQTLTDRGLEAAVAQHAALKGDTVAYSVGESQLNTLGYKLLQRGRLDDAIRIFQVNAAAFPQSANVHDSLGEAYFLKGDRARARESYEKSLALDPDNAGAMEVLRWLRS